METALLDQEKRNDHGLPPPIFEILGILIIVASYIVYNYLS